MPKYTAMIDAVDETDELYLLVWEDGGDPQPKHQWKLSVVVDVMNWSSNLFKSLSVDRFLRRGNSGAEHTWTNAISPDAGMPQRGVKGK